MVSKPKYKNLIKPNKGIVNPEGQRVSIQSGIIFSNPTADLLVTGPNEEFLYKIKQAFQLDACFVRYNAQVDRYYKRIVVFAIAGLPPAQEREFANWISYLKHTRLEPFVEANFTII